MVGQDSHKWDKLLSMNYSNDGYTLSSTSLSQALP